MRARDVIELFAIDPEPPLEDVALAIACDALPDIDPEREALALDELAAPLKSRGALLHRPIDQAALLGTYVYDELGFAGDEETYDDPRNSYLPMVIARRRGIPITLAVLLAALGRRAGMDVEGVGFPGHFLVRLGGPSGVYVDPFFRARVLHTGDLTALLQRVTGESVALQDEHTAVVGARAVAVRMLVNLKNTSAAARCAEGAWWCAIVSSTSRARRSRGAIAGCTRWRWARWRRRRRTCAPTSTRGPTRRTPRR